MLMDTWREWLYPLGYIAQLAFGLRFLQQWLSSEKQGKSVITASFWGFSLVGNILLLIHAFIQLQFHLCVIQICNAVISWRNLNLMQQKRPPASLKTVVTFMIGSIALTALLFIAQGFLWDHGSIEWFRLPTWKGVAADQVNYLWHIIGITGMLLFTSRFWVQWWSAEKQHQSHLGLSFWWLSLAGACLTILYSFHIKDPVNIIGPGVGLIPYIRNMILIYTRSEPKADPKANSIRTL